PDLPSTGRHRVVRLRGEDEVVDADLVEAPQPERVAAEAGDALLPAVVRPDAVVGEDAVEVEDDEPDLGEWRHSLRAATASCAGTSASSSTASSSASARVSVRPSRSSSA